MINEDTSWGHVAEWYDDLLELTPSTYQRDLILPNIMRLMDPASGDVIHDLGCGQGFFSRECAKRGARVIGSDISPELISIAERHDKDNISYHVLSSDMLSSIPDGSLTKIACILALENIEHVKNTLLECARTLKDAGSMHVVINHPAFRIPRASSWGWDEEHKVQYRRVDSYLSEMKVRINMHPGDRDKESVETITFHRPLQYYVKSFRSAGFAISTIEEWNSKKTSEEGPRKRAEDRARKEIPMFMYIGVTKSMKS